MIAVYTCLEKRIPFEDRACAPGGGDGDVIPNSDHLDPEAW